MGYSHSLFTDLSLSPFSNTKHNNSTLTTNISATAIATSALNHGHLACSANEAEVISHEQQVALGSSRWNPTPEQLMALEEMYRRGTRTPSATQIQQIAMRLQRFGKIEGKNVFYWFQNHKARERSKRRRQQSESLENKESGSVSEIQLLANNHGPPPNLSETSSEQFISTHRTAAAASKSKANEWIQIQEELHVIKSRVGRAMEELPFSPIYLMTTSTTTTTTNSLLETQNDDIITSLEDKNREDQTLELFPLRSNEDVVGGINISNSKKDSSSQVPITAINTTPNHYFEFLPLKN